ncbi:glycosylphosphatidylinositol anchor attachment 1 protein-like [Amphiura filiformis]|uniref:glycosylphosphatidylinositol anchor attachment 1 protein-like n=1 Tax=Amphiura filiformis TaxID=82378 RepID=UPI003B211823
MGLLTDPKTQATVSRLISKYYAVVSIFFYIIGIIYMLSLAHYPLSAGTYFSENALLPALVEREYHSETDTRTYANELREVARGTPKGAIPEQWLYSKFRELGLDVYSQNYTVSHPFMETVTSKKGPSKTKVITGTNVYGILRAPRLAGTEAIVLTVPYRSLKQVATFGSTNHGIGLMLSLASYFRRHTYWSKDIIFLVVEHEEIGMRAWLESYHDTKSSYITSSLMSGRSGSVMGAINLELGSESLDHIDIMIEGPNGQLPNLDLFNLAVRLCKREGIAVTFQNRQDALQAQWLRYDGFKHSMKTMLLNMAHQASGKPSGIHGLFLQYHIEALTLKGYPSQSRRAQSIVSVGRVLEGMTRSINNLLERLHQSFFFYILPSTERYISIGLYMPPFGLLMVVPILHGLALWIASGKVEDDKEGEEKVGESDEKHSDEKKDSQVEAEPPQRPFSLVIPLMIGAFVTGVLLFYCPQYFITRYSAAFGLKPNEGITIGLLAFLVGCIFLPYLGRSKNQQSTDLSSKAEWQLLKSFALIWQGVSLSAIAMMNFSLAFFIAVVTIPVYTIVRPSKKRIFRIIQSALLVLVSPYGLVLIGILIYQANTINYDSYGQLLLDTLFAAQDAMYNSVVDRCLYGSWSYGLATLVVFPNWMLFWMVVWRKQQ